MNAFDKICLVIIIALAAFSLYLMISFLIALVREKEKAVVGSLESLISILVCYVVFGLIFCIDKSPIFGFAALAELFTFPCTVFVILTPKGICRLSSIKPKYKPVSDLSYEFRNNHLEIYSSSKSSCSRYQLGIKSTKTVKMLADWYPKHNYTNPLAPAENENKGE